MPDVTINETSLPALTVGSPASFQPTVTSSETVTAQYENDDGGSDTQELTLDVDEEDDAVGATWLIDDPVSLGLVSEGQLDGSEVAAGQYAAFVTGMNGWTYEERDAHAESVVDAGATGGRVIRLVYPPLDLDPSSSYGPGVFYNPLPSAARSFYFRARAGLSANWQGHPSGINKLFFIGQGPGSNEVLLTARGASAPYRLSCIILNSVETSDYLDNNLDLDGGDIAAGELANIEIWFDATVGTLGMAVNRVQVLDRIGNDGYVAQPGGSGQSDQSFAFGDLPTSQVEWPGTWGGLDGEVTEEMWEEVDHMEIWTGSGGELNAYNSGV